MKKGIKIAADKLIEFLSEISFNCESEEDLFNVANVSSNYDRNISKIISKALYGIGKNGMVQIEPGYSIKNELNVSKFFFFYFILLE